MYSKHRLWLTINSLESIPTIDNRLLYADVLNCLNRNIYSIKQISIPELNNVYDYEYDMVKQLLYSKYLDIIKDTEQGLADLIMRDLMDKYQNDIMNSYSHNVKMYIVGGGDPEPSNKPTVGKLKVPTGLGGLPFGNMSAMVLKSREQEATGNLDKKTLEEIKKEREEKARKIEEERERRDLEEHEGFQKLNDDELNPTELKRKRELILKYVKVFSNPDGSGNTSETEVIDPEKKKELLAQIIKEQKKRGIEPTKSVARTQTTNNAKNNPPAAVNIELPKSIDIIEKEVLDNILKSPDTDQDDICEDLNLLKNLIIESYLTPPQNKPQNPVMPTKVIPVVSSKKNRENDVKRLNNKVKFYNKAFKENKMPLWRHNYMYFKYLVLVSKPIQEPSQMSKDDLVEYSKLIGSYQVFNDITFRGI